MIFLGIGANLPSERYGAPRATCGAALEHIEKSGISLISRAPWYESAPVPASDQPWYVNGVIEVTTSLPPNTLMQDLLRIEAALGRLRGLANAPRTVDLDILAYGEMVLEPTESDPLQLHIPHPRMHERSFVINPLYDISPNWVHPRTGRTISDLKVDLSGAQITRQMTDADGLFGTEWPGEK